ncbi:MAG: tyrosine-type recombinase/integrase family protein [Firmicutes bacterium]|nr:tyrosine-type recombinase/integrase family protein [Bacillota bacterium]
MRKSFTYQGKRYYIRCKDETEFEVKKALLLKDIEEEKVIESTMLVRDWAAEWLETYKSAQCNEKTYKDYTNRLNNYILPEIGHIRLKDVKPVHLQKILHNVRNMSQSRIDKMYQCICQIFTAAENNDLVIKSPARGLVKPKGVSGSHRAITDYERAMILKVAEDHPHGLWIKIMLYCGLRPGETSRIKIMHFDYDKELLFIDGTKTYNAKRYVPISPELLQEVSLLNKDPFEYLFTNKYGMPINENNRKYMWKSFKKALHVEMGGKLYYNGIVEPCRVAPDLVPYCLRHTFCTDLQDAGVPINVARDLMGHSDIALTSKIYTHTTDRAIENAATLINEFHKVAR